MKPEKKTILRLSFYCLWLIAALLQSRFTELINDEAYYWKYSTMLDWGYFDHPPVVALLIKLGYFVFHNEAGVRLFFILMQVCTIYLIERLINPKNLKLFYIIIASIALVHVGGILALPDVPLLFFSSLFFHFYRRYIHKPGWVNGLLLAMIMCLMLLSKYHAILIIGFTVLSNLKILKKGSFWFAITICLLLLIPHFYWQIENNYPTFKYQLFERSSESYSFLYTLEYLIVQPFVFGPLIGAMLLFYGFTFKPANQFEKTMKFNLIGIYVFFLLMTLRGRIEAHWTLCCMVPLLYFGYNRIERSVRSVKFVQYSFPVSLFLILCLRVFMVWDFTPKVWAVKTEFHGYRDWTHTIDSVAKGRPVAFMNSYQKAAKYEYYSGSPAFSLNNIMGRKNQYTIWDIENEYQGKEIMLIPNYWGIEFHNVHTGLEDFQYMFIKNFRSYSNVLITTDESKIMFSDNQPNKLNIKFKYINKNKRDLQGNADIQSYVSYQFFKGKGCIFEKNTDLRITNDMIDSDRDYEISVVPPKEKGTYYLYISVHTAWWPSTINSDAIKAEVL